MPLPLPEISKLVVPGLNGDPGGIYALKDTYARQLLSGGIEHRIVWNGTDTPVVANIPNTVSVIYNNTVYTGTLTPENGEPMVFYLVRNTDSGVNSYAEYAVATDASTNTKIWEKFGDTGSSLTNLGAIAYMDAINLEKGDGYNVIGENATLQAQSSSVSFDGHTTAPVLGASTTFGFTDPVYSLTPTKGNISLSRTTDVALSTPSNSAVTALDTTNSTKASFIKAETGAFERKKIESTSLRGVTGNTTSATVTINPTKHKLLTSSFTSVTIGSASVGDYLSIGTTKLVTTTVKGVSDSTTTASVISNKTTKTLATDTFKKVTKITSNNSTNSEWKDTIANLDFHMYSSNTDGTSGVFADADNETLVISYKTMPSLKLSDTETTFATGKNTDNETATYVKDFTATDVTVPVANSNATPVATGALDANGSGGVVVNSVQSNGTIPIPQSDSRVVYATGKIGGSVGDDGAETNGGYVVTDVPNGSTSIPEIDASATNVLIKSLDTATSNSSDVNVLTQVTLTGHTADAYTGIAFETSSFLTGASVNTQPVFTASVAENNNGAVLTGVSISNTSSGAITVGTNNQVSAITALGAATAAAQSVSFNSKDIKKVALYDDLKIKTESHPATRYLNFLPPNGGTIYFNRVNSAISRNFEISYDGVNWQLWTYDSENSRYAAQLASGERLYIRGISETQQRLSTSADNYWQFVVPDGTAVNGIVESLLCRTPEFGEIGNLSNNSHHFTNLFRDCKITGRPIINSKTLKTQSLEYMFRNTQITEIEMHSLTRDATVNPLSGWLLNPADSGKIYMPDDFSISTNSTNGIPSGWTRVSI